MKTLRQYLDEERGRGARLAELVGTSLASITRIADGQQNASADVLLKIEAATDGEVTAAAMIKTIGEVRYPAEDAQPKPQAAE